MNEKAIDNSAGGCLILIFPIAFLIIFLFATWPVLLAAVVASAIWSIWQRYQWQQWCNQVNPIFHQLVRENRGSITALDLAMKANFSAAIAKRYLDAKAEEFGAQRRDYEDQGTVYYFITSSTLGSLLDESEPPSLPEKTDVGFEKSPSADISGEAKLPSEVLAAGVSTSRQEGTSLEDETDSQSLSENQNQTLQPQDLSHSTSHTTEPEAKVPQPTESAAYEPAVDQRETTAASDQTSTDHPLPPTGEEELQPTSPIDTSGLPKSLIQSELAKRLDVHSSTVYKHREDPDFAEWSRSRDPEGIAWKFSPDTKEFSPLEEEGSRE